MSAGAFAAGPELAALAAFAAMWAGIVAMARMGEGLFRAAGPRMTERLDSVLRHLLGRPVDGPAFAAQTLAVLAVAIVGLAVVLDRPLAILGVVAAAAALPFLLFRRAEARLRRDLERTLPAALQQVANEMAARPSLERALDEVSRTAEYPASEELALLQRNIETLGLELALNRTAEKLDSRSFTLMASVLRVGSQQGGRLSDALKNLSRTLMEIERLNQKIVTASANSRRVFLFMIFAGLLIPAGAMQMPGAETVFQSTVGQVLMMLAAALFVGGLLLARRMMRVNV